MSREKGIQVERVEYGGWPNCYRLSNDLVDLVVTTDVGPRVIRLGFVGEANLFKEYPDLMGLTGGDEWRIYGGHRLWVAPESKERSYVPDNQPIQLEERPGFVRLVQPPDAGTGIQKEIDLRLVPGEARVEVTHRLRNTTAQPVELAPWALSVMAQGGVVVIPFPPRGTHGETLLPSSSLTLWPYTDMADPRWLWGSRYIMLRQDPGMDAAQKVGALVPDGWAAYARDGYLFVVRAQFAPDARYPDLGSSVETFTNADMLEVETLGPLIDLQPQAAVEHLERWFLFRDVPAPESEADIDQHILPKVRLTE